MLSWLWVVNWNGHGGWDEMATVGVTEKVTKDFDVSSLISIFSKRVFWIDWSYLEVGARCVGWVVAGRDGAAIPNRSTTSTNNIRQICHSLWKGYYDDFKSSALFRLRNETRLMKGRWQVGISGANPNTRHGRVSSKLPHGDATYRQNAIWGKLNPFQVSILSIGYRLAPNDHNVASGADAKRCTADQTKTSSPSHFFRSRMESCSLQSGRYSRFAAFFPGDCLMIRPVLVKSFKVRCLPWAAKGQPSVPITCD